MNIGASSNPRQMLAILQAGNPAELELMGSVDARLYPEEWWHDTLSPWRLRGAWYEPKAQVLCRVEDALSGRLEAPGRIDPVLDPLDDSELLEAAEAPLERVPAEVRAVFSANTPEARARQRWAWPKVDPYPPVNARPIPVSQALPILRKLASRAA